MLDVREGFYDEMVDASGAPREHARTLVDALTALGTDELAAAGRRRDAIFMQQGITFDAAGPDHDGPTRDRPFPLDLVPRIIPAEEWRTIKRGLAQRIRALNAFIDDVYHGREIVHDGLVPWELIVSRSGFARAAHGIRPPGGVYCHVSGCDLVRDGDGSWKVLEDNVRTATGSPPATCPATCGPRRPATRTPSRPRWRRTRGSRRSCRPRASRCGCRPIPPTARWAAKTT